MLNAKVTLKITRKSQGENHSNQFYISIFHHYCFSLNSLLDAVSVHKIIKSQNLYTRKSATRIVQLWDCVPHQYNVLNLRRPL